MERGMHWAIRRNQPSQCPVRNVAVLSRGFHATALFNCVENHALLSNYYGRKYIDNYSNTASGIPAYLGLFVSCLSDTLVDIVT
jgi:hypothetical protein